MAIVGTAFVRLKVIGDTLKKDLAKNVHDAVDTSPEMTGAGEKVGEKITEGVEKHFSGGTNGFDKVADDIGNAIGSAMGKSLGRSLPNRLSKPFKDSFAKLKPVVSKAGTDLSGAFKTFKTGMEKQAKKIKLGDLMFGGIAGAVIALPSLLAGAGAVIGAYAATAITALSALGPAVAGGAIAGVAAMTSLKIATGLFGLAMKTNTPILEDFKKRSEAFKVSLATPVQVGLLSGLNASMRILGPVLTAVTPQLTAFGMAAGDVALNFADAIRQASMISRIQTILANTTGFVTSAGAGVGALGQAFIILVSHLGPVITFIGDLVRDIGNFVLQATLAGEASGKLDGFITRSFDALRRFVGILVDFGIGIANVFKAAHGASGGMLDSLENIGRKFREWTGDQANQERMTAFFEKMRTVVAGVNEILGKLAGSGLKALEGTNVDSLLTGLKTLESLGPPIAQMFNAIKDAAGPKLQEMFQNFADIITSLAESGIIGILSSAFANLFAVIAQVLALPGVGTILSFVAGLAVMMKTVGLLINVLKLLFPAIKLIFTVIRVLAAVFGGIPLAIAAVVIALVWFFTQTELGRKLIAKAFEGIKIAFFAVKDALIVAFHAVVAAFQAVGGWIANVAQSIWSVISTVFGAVLSTVSTVWNAIFAVVSTVLGAVWSFITSIFGTVLGFISGVLNGILAVFQVIFNAVVTVVSTYLNILWAIWSRIFPILLLPIRIFYGLVILVWQLIFAGIQVVLGLIFTVVTTIWNAIFGAITAVLGFIWNIITTVWNAIFSAIGAALDAIWGVITSVWNAVSGFINGVLSAIGSFIAGIWNDMLHVISVALDAIWSVISSIWNSVSGFINTVLNGIKSIVSGVWDGIVSAVTTSMDAIWNGITSVWNNINSFLQGAMDTVKSIVGGIWDALGDAGSSVVGGLKSAVNGAIGIINGAIGGINGLIHTANRLPGVDIPDITPIPTMAKGGVVSPSKGGTLALIAEAGRKERVEPLDGDGLSKRDRAILNQFSLAAGSGGGGNVNVYLGTKELAQLVEVVVEERETDTANRVKTRKKGI